MELESVIGKGLLEGRFILTGQGIMDKKNGIPPVKVCFDDDGGEPNNCDPITLLKFMNKQETLKNRSEKRLEAIITLFDKELESADGELKEALIRISHIELEV